jgi:hypothetical protein
VPTYSDATLDYDEVDRLYDGVQIDLAGLTLVVGNADVTDYLAARSLKVSANTHGNAHGTLGAVLNDPPAVPATEQEVRLYVEGLSRFLGVTKAIGAREFRGGHLFVTIDAQAEAQSEGIPTSSPWDVSDTPNGTTTFGYESLSRQERTTEGGAAKTSFELVMRKDGLWIDQNVDVTAANYDLSAETFTIREASVEWPTADAPRYTLTLGDPLVRLTEVVRDHDVEEVENATAEVIVNEAGLTITNGKLTVTNPGGTVVIDGTSNMFKIIASGTVQHTELADQQGVSDTLFPALGDDWDTIPIAFAGLSFFDGVIGNVRQVNRAINMTKSYAAHLSGGSPTKAIQGIEFEASLGSFINSTTGFAAIRLGFTNWSGEDRTVYARFHLCQEAAI